MKTKKTVKKALPEVFNQENFYRLCDHLAGLDEDLKLILDKHGYPPMWTRENSLETLVHIVLEQQVSLASALAALNKLKEKIKIITPDNILQLTDDEMRACFVSRQKTIYIRGMAQAIKSNEINLEVLPDLPSDEVRKILINLKGIGNWTIDVYLMFTLQRADVFPIGDLAAVNALKRLKKLDPEMNREALLEITHNWKPLRSVASMMLWHYYLSQSKVKKTEKKQDRE
ncbi:DNA-3-methyladenine glycosylase family protein [Taibaiella soli]|uniref:DNA-3-methyladenine glycosylase II n=1 Tax=Taibaiella soli TaxID=1649169 RepID=A0A2W2B4X4_9BACT|nr:DNA-3-methyladenine glycosylase [Taibaiella soli]PZF71137.1 DNA-3-methyladenine glycosylase 2 family protein [Taibaiella soli]